MDISRVSFLTSRDFKSPIWDFLGKLIAKQILKGLCDKSPCLFAYINNQSKPNGISFILWSRKIFLWDSLWWKWRETVNWKKN